MNNRINLLSAKNGEQNIQFDSKLLYSRYNPSVSSERLADNASYTPRTIYFLPSPLLGYGISSIIEHLPADSLILGIEIDQDLMLMSAPYLKKFQDDTRCEIFRLDDPVSLYRVFIKLDPGRFRSCRLIPLNGGYQINKKRYDTLFSSLQQFLQNYWRNRLTSVKLGRLWIRNLLSNMALSGGRTLNQFKTNKPVVLAGAGESLEGALPMLKQYRDTFFILCVDTAIQPLVRSGILPDGVVNLEAQFHNLKDFYSLAGKKIRQFADITAYPSSLRDFPGDQYFFASSFGQCVLVDNLASKNLLPPEIPALGSVGVTALYVAGEITDGPIFLTGLDFGYTEGKSHSRETPFHDWMRLREGRMAGDPWYSFTRERPSQTSSSKNGNPKFKTNPILLQYGNQLRDMCQFMEGRVFDLALGGMDLGLPVIDAKKAVKIARQQEIKESGEESKIPDLSNRNEQIEEFLLEELSKLKTIIDTWRKVDKDEDDPSALLPLFKSCDYIYFHFPDRHMLPNTRPEFLFRAMESAGAYKRLVESLLQ